MPFPFDIDLTIAQVDACLGGRFAEWANWKPADALENTQRAMQAAEQALGVETVIFIIKYFFILLF